MSQTSVDILSLTCQHKQVKGNSVGNEEMNTFKEVLCRQPEIVVPEVGRRADILLGTNEALNLPTSLG